MEERTSMTCGNCGRSFATLEPKCNYCNSCLTEYPCTARACIRKDADPCKAKAVIPAITVDTVDGLTNLANCFVHVTSINTTFYVDDKHRPMIVWAGPVEKADYNIVTNELNLRSQFCLTNIDDAEVMVYFDKQGVPHVIGQEG